MNTEMLHLAEGDIAYDSCGNGPLVVCIPGMGDLRGQYRFLAPQLAAAGNRVVTMDVRGHGESGTGWNDFSVSAIGRDVVELVRTLDAGPAVIIGNSMAAGAAVWAAVEAPELVNGLVLIGPAVRGAIKGAFAVLTRLLFSRPWGARAWLAYFSTLFPARKPDDWNEYTRRLRANLAEKGRLESLQKMIFAPKDAAEQRLARVGVPSLVLMGTKDPDFKDPEGEARFVAGSTRGAVTMIPGAGHYPHTEVPETAGPVIVSFVTSTNTAGVGSGLERGQTAR